jgi:hypothetical protein
MRCPLARLSIPLLLSVSVFAIEARAQSAPPPTPAAAPAASQQLLKAEELDQIMAPIALYPDALLANVLMASTYPLEVVEADRWAKANKNLKGEQLKAEVTKQRWDDSVKQLAATPSVLDLMSSKLDWTQKLGDAVLAQQADVMDSVQRLRSKADAQNTLKTTKEQKVTKQTQQGKQVIVIEPAQPETMYVPYYDPATAYGAWPYPDYPPYYYPQPAWYPGTLAAGAIGFGIGWAVGAAWGGGFGWGNNNINIDRGDISIGGGNRWSHNVEHRGGVRYNNRDVAQKFGKGDRGGAQQRMDFRGRDGQQVIKPGGDRPGGGDRAGLGDRDRPGAGDRPGGGDRPGAGAGKGGDRVAGKGGDRPGAGKGGERPGAGKGGAGNRPQQRPAGGQRPGGGREGGLGNPGHGRNAMAHADRGRASMGARPGGGGGPRAGGHPGGGARVGGGGPRGGGGARGGGGRRSDVALKHDVILLGTLDSGIGFYRFAYYGSDKAYVGVMAQEVQAVMPNAIVQGRDGYLRVRYEKLRFKFETYEQWLAAGSRLPTAAAGTR